MICEYGCGKEAKYPPGYKYKTKSLKKWCCSELYQKCLGYIAKNPALQKKPLLDRFQTGYNIEDSKNLESIKKSEEIYNIKLENKCWIWKKYKDRDGYGNISDENDYPRQAHRISYGLFVEKIPDGKIVAHYCDEPSCVNPNHLFLATNLENNKDRQLKNRSANGLKNGMYTKPETRSFGNYKACSLWKVKFPDGHEENIKNLTKICRDYKISYDIVRNSRHGWKVELLEKFTERIIK